MITVHHFLSAPQERAACATERIGAAGRSPLGSSAKPVNPYKGRIPQGMMALLILGWLVMGCTTPPSLSEKALEKATVCAPAYDVTYEVLWKSAITAVQEIGYSPIDSYRENLFIKTDLRIEKEDVVARTKEASMIYIFFEKAKNTLRESYVMRICAPRYESPTKEENWKYLQSDTEIQQRIQARFQKVLERMYRQGFKG